MIGIMVLLSGDHLFQPKILKSMKKPITTLLFSAIAGFVVAQPQLKSANMVIGDVFDLYQINNITLPNVASSGPDITWNISTGTPLLMGTATFVDPATTTYGSTYPDANFAIKFAITPGTFYNMLKNSANGSEEVATNVGSPSPTVYTTFRLFLPATMNYTDSVARAFQKSGQPASMAFLKYDAWGKLTTSDSTYNNLGRVYRTDLQSNIFIGWYANNGRYPVLIYDGSQFLYFRKKSTVTTLVKETNASFNLSVYPNPAGSELNILCNTSIEKVEVYNLTGILQSSVIHKNKIDISDLSTGMYFVKVFSENGMTTKNFVKE